MPQAFNFPTLLSQVSQSVKRTVFISYHHGGDQQYYDAFTRAFDDTYDVIFDNSMERRIDSDDVRYVIQRIRDNFITGSSCTIVLCGAQTPWRKYVDWEIKATLDREHGIIGVSLPTIGQNANGQLVVPGRLHDNIQSGYAIWMNWNTFTQSGASVKASIEQAITKPAQSIINSRQMMSRNGTPSWPI